MPKRTFDKLSFSARMGITALCAVLFALVLCLIFSFVAYMSEDPTKNLTLYGEICYLATMLFCGFTGAKLSRENKFLCGIISGGILLVLSAIGALIFSENPIKSLILATLGMFLCTTAAVLGAREPKRKRRTH